MFRVNFIFQLFQKFDCNFFQTATAGADLVLRFLVRFKLLLLVDVEFLVIECWGELVLELSRRVLCGPV